MRIATGLRTWLAQPSSAFQRKVLTRRLMSATLRVACWSLVLVLLPLGLRDFLPGAANAPTNSPPTLTQLNRSIDQLETYLDRLYRPLPGGMAVQSETTTTPVRVHLRDDTDASTSWVLLGQGGTGCIERCAVTSIRPGVASDTEESYTLTFGERLKIGLAINWKVDKRHFSVTVAPQEVRSAADVWLNDVKLASFTPGVTTSFTRTFPLSKLELFKSLRYTVRHAVQEAYMYWTLRGDKKKAGALARFLRTNGFVPGMDMRAAAFGMSASLPDDLPFDSKAYEDCEHVPPPTTVAYPYRSKACLAQSSYLNIAARDAFLQASLALHVVQKYDKDYEYAGSNSWLAWTQGSTPQETSHHLQRQWRRLGYGIPSCNPVACGNYASSIRTSAFGALETVLGYDYGDKVARSYADAAAVATLKSQIGSDGIIRHDSSRLYRPVQAGAIPVAWNESGAFVAPSDTSLLAAPASLLFGRLSMPPEYIGIQASNTETSMDAWAFLVRYRCAVYGVSCMIK